MRFISCVRCTYNKGLYVHKWYVLKIEFITIAIDYVATQKIYTCIYLYIYKYKYINIMKLCTNNIFLQNRYEVCIYYCALSLGSNHYPVRPIVGIYLNCLAVELYTREILSVKSHTQVWNGHGVCAPINSGTRGPGFVPPTHPTPALASAIDLCTRRLI